MPTKIPWTDESWNPVVGCTKCSPGCLNCYAERMARRLAGMGQCKYETVTEIRGKEGKGVFGGWNGRVVCSHPALEIPLHWRKPRRIFIDSMGDLFHPKVPFEFIQSVLGVIAVCPKHKFLLLTKRPKKMAELSGAYPDNAQLGISISTQAEDWKIIELLKISAAVRFVSLEPLLEAVDISKYVKLREKCFGTKGCGFIGNLDEFVNPQKAGAFKCPQCKKTHSFLILPSLDWVIIGCESGPKRRPCKIEWVRDIVNQCKAAGVAVFVKQIPINGKVSRNPSEWPADLRLQQYPEDRQ